MARFGAGVVATHDSIKAAAQAKFFDVALQVVPAMGQSIRDVVVPAIFAWLYPAGQMVREVELDEAAANPWMVPLNIYDAVHATVRFRPDLLGLRDALHQWGAEWHLAEPWALELALRYAGKSCGHYWESLDSYEPGIPFDSLLSDDERRVTITIELLDPEEEDVGSYIRRMVPRLERFLREKCDEMVVLAQARGAVASKIKQDRVGADLHFELLARRQCSGLSYRDLVEFARPQITSRSALIAAVQSTAELVGLTLRPPNPGGRPRNSGTAARP